MLNEDEDLALKNEKNADIFNGYFGSVVENLNMEQWYGCSTTLFISKILNDVIHIIKNILTTLV